MNMPGFTAEASLCAAGLEYRNEPNGGGLQNQRVVAELPPGSGGPNACQRQCSSTLHICLNQCEDPNLHIGFGTLDTLECTRYCYDTWRSCRSGCSGAGAGMIDF